VPGQSGAAGVDGGAHDGLSGRALLRAGVQLADQFLTPDQRLPILTRCCVSVSGAKAFSAG
jgi:hypothetical protein